VRVREIDDDDGQRLLRIIRRGSGSVVTSRRAQVVVLSAQGMAVTKIAEGTFTSPDQVREVGTADERGGCRPGRPLPGTTPQVSATKRKLQPG
jgi:hypothetical protein